MPDKYIRKVGATPRGRWSANQLQSAMNAVTDGSMGVREAANSFSIPKSTLIRRLRSNNAEKNSRLGPDSTLGAQAENKLANHIKKLQKFGFSPSRREVREMAYKLAKRMNIRHRFNENAGK